MIRVDADLLSAVIKTTGVRKKAQALRQALEEFLRAHKRSALRRMAGRVPMYTQSELARMRDHD